MTSYQLSASFTDPNCEVGIFRSLKFIMKSCVPPKFAKHPATRFVARVAFSQSPSGLSPSRSRRFCKIHEYGCRRRNQRSFPASWKTQQLLSDDNLLSRRSTPYSALEPSSRFPHRGIVCRLTLSRIAGARDFVSPTSRRATERSLDLVES
jgi:hypothetical protein